MFSEVQRNYIQQMVLSNKAGYKYYVAVTNTNVSGSGVSDNVSFYLYLSDKPFTAPSRYRYTTEGDCVRLAVRSGNASYNYHTERVIQSAGASTITVDNYEFVYTNADFSGYAMQPDLLATNLATQSHFDGFSLAILVIITAIIFSKIMRGGGGYAKI